MSKNSLAIYALIALALSSGAPAQTNDQIAAQFVPSATFDAYATNNHLSGDNRTWDVLPADLDHSGHADYLAVAYGNGMIAYLRIIKKASGPTLVAESGMATSCDGAPSVSTVNLDCGSRPAMVLKCRVGNRGNQFASLFKWEDAGLIVLNPPSDRRPGSWIAIQEPNFVDVDGDGVMEVLEPSGSFDRNDQFSDQRYDVYKLVDGHLVKSQASLAFYTIFSGGTGTPTAQTYRFAAAPGTYVLTVANGERGSNLSDSAVISLNGNEILGSSALSSKRAIFTVPVTLAAQNTITGELRSAPGSFIHLLVSPAAKPASP
jgi:hypothetical protein